MSILFETISARAENLFLIELMFSVASKILLMFFVLYAAKSYWAWPGDSILVLIKPSVGYFVHLQILLITLGLILWSESLHDAVRSEENDNESSPEPERLWWFNVKNVINLSKNC